MTKRPKEPRHTKYLHQLYDKFSCYETNCRDIHRHPARYSIQYRESMTNDIIYCTSDSTCTAEYRVLIYMLLYSYQMVAQNTMCTHEGKNKSLNRPRFFIFIFLLKNSLLDHTHRPTCKFLILSIFNHAKLNPENLVYKKFYYIKI